MLAQPVVGVAQRALEQRAFEVAGDVLEQQEPRRGPGGRLEHRPGRVALAVRVGAAPFAQRDAAVGRHARHGRDHPGLVRGAEVDHRVTGVEGVVKQGVERSGGGHRAVQARGQHRFYWLVGDAARDRFVKSA